MKCIGSISLLLVIIAFFGAFEIQGFCLGDSVLATLNIPTWSNSANASGTHYTIFYTYIFLIPALILAIKYKNDSFVKVGKRKCDVSKLKTVIRHIQLRKSNNTAHTKR